MFRTVLPYSGPPRAHVGRRVEGDVVSFVLWLLLGLLLLVFLYWLIVVGEGTYLGRPAVRLIYQLGAGVYDQTRKRVTANDQVVLLPLLRETLAGQPAPRVLDVATGTGRVPLLLASQPWFGGQIDAIDLTPAMLDRARAKLNAAGLEARAKLLQGDAGRLPWPDASFDLVVSLEALEFFSRPRRALAEMARVLRPGGALIVSKYPDPWARVLPFKSLTRRAMTRLLEYLGLRAIAIREWQPGHYELVTARKL
ncbi:MAG TPA: class I SAM-dependent methyltransferase [Roseiflexaceae bacterium]|nr:class I SAM-dependent methyltransferase [Roseiflexaceae bacterium]